MFMMCVDATRQVLLVECSGRLSTAEAVRAVKHAGALVAAGGLRGVACDLRGVRRGPGFAARVAAAIAGLDPMPAVRAAFVVGERGMARGQRFADRAGDGIALRVFAGRAEADCWLAGEAGLGETAGGGNDAAGPSIAKAGP